VRAQRISARERTHRVPLFVRTKKEVGPSLLSILHFSQEPPAARHSKTAVCSSPGFSRSAHRSWLLLQETHAVGSRRFLPERQVAMYRRSSPSCMRILCPPGGQKKNGLHTQEKGSRVRYYCPSDRILRSLDVNFCSVSNSLPHSHFAADR
jgi:hypothetical protein